MKKILLVAFIISIFICGCGKDNNVKTIEASGTIEATDVIVSAKTFGEIKLLNVDEGSKVKRGDTLLVIDYELLNIQLKQAIAGRDQVSAQFQMLKNGARIEDVKQTEEMLKQAEINFNTADKDKVRMQSLYESKSITKKQYEDAISRYDLTLAQLNFAKETYNKIKNFARPEELKQAEANLRKSESSVELIIKNIKDCFVISPIDGFIVKKFVEKGETVNQTSSLFKISDLSIVELIIYVSEEEMGSVKLGQKANVQVDAFKEKVFDGKVIYISPEAEFTPKNIQTKDERTKLVFAVKIEIHNPEFELKSGMPADALIKL